MNDPADIARAAELTHLEHRVAALELQVEQAGDLLAVMHGDGGHYIAKHGWKKACADAKKIRHSLVERVDQLEALVADLDISARTIHFGDGTSRICCTPEAASSYNSRCAYIVKAALDWFAHENGPCNSNSIEAERVLYETASQNRDLASYRSNP